jgi:hypothetical protein
MLTPRPGGLIFEYYGKFKTLYLEQFLGLNQGTNILLKKRENLVTHSSFKYGLTSFYLRRVPEKKPVMSNEFN